MISAINKSWSTDFDIKTITIINNSEKLSRSAINFNKKIHLFMGSWPT